MKEEKIRYHEDDIEKKPLRNEDIRFLQALQREMNTQDTLGQADPRFWVIKGREKLYVSDVDDYVLLLNGTEVASSFEDAASYVSSEAFTADTTIKAAAEYRHSFVFGGILSVRSEDLPGWEDLTFYSMEELVEWLNEYLQAETYSAVPYMEQSRFYADTFFLTRKEALEHLKKNHYHYAKDAHTYAMTAWRAPDVERLYGILEESDFEDVQKALGYKELLDRIIDNLLSAGKTSEVLRYLLYLGFSRKDLLDLNFEEADIDEEGSYMNDLTDFSGICPIF